MKYQSGPRWQGVRLNIAMIGLYVNAQAKTAVDIGSNEGYLTHTLGMLGLSATGFERNFNYYAQANQIASSNLVKFQNRLFTLDDAQDLHDVDVVLFLSVHHQIAMSHGLEHADEFLRRLCSNAKMQVFFQPAMIEQKYQSKIPFKDNDYASAQDYFSSIARSAGMPFTSTVGFSINDLPRNEPLRPMIVFSRTPLSLRNDIDIERLIAKTSLIAGHSAFAKAKSSRRSRLREIINRISAH